MAEKLRLFVFTFLFVTVLNGPVLCSPVFEQQGDVVEDGQQRLVSVVKREAPSTVDKLTDKASDLDTSATGYGHGHGGGYADAPTGYVNYGAKTGGYGAFSWYSDHPVGGGYGYH